MVLMQDLLSLEFVLTFSLLAFDFSSPLVKFSIAAKVVVVGVAFTSAEWPSYGM